MLSSPRMRARRLVATAAAVFALGVGTVAGANAATGSSTTTTPAAAASVPSTTTSAPSAGAVSHGPGETLLTGSDLAKATAAARTAVPGGSKTSLRGPWSAVTPWVL